MEKKIFISHSHRDKVLVDVLVSEISKVLGYSKTETVDNIFNSSSPYTIRTGDNWLNDVFDALDDADVLIPLVTPSSEKSMWVAFEYGYFWNKVEDPKRRILPLTHTIHPASPLNDLQHRRVTNEGELKQFFSDLCELEEFNCKGNQPDLKSIIEQAEKVPRLSAEDRQLQLECTLHLKTTTDVDVKKFIIQWMGDKDINILHDANFVGIDLQGVEFKSANMQRVNFGGCNLSGASFWDCNLENAIFGSTILEGTSFQKISSVKNASFQGIKHTSYIILDDGVKYPKDIALNKLVQLGAVTHW